MKLRIFGNTALLKEAELFRDDVGVLRLALTTTERGADFHLGSITMDDNDQVVVGPVLLLAPPEGIECGRGCQVLIEGETPEEKNELEGVTLFTSQSKENLYAAVLPVWPKQQRELTSWEA